MRKAPDIWRRWTVNSGNGLHNLQLRIALQAARLLQVCAGHGVQQQHVCQSNSM
jgi:16S rRNA C967 or C1407 C5-methylase (RsmB/RsmF family)